MPFCPISMDDVEPGRRYSRQGLRRLHPRLDDLADLQLDGRRLIEEAAARAGKMSIQGAQPKLCAVLRVKVARFDIVDSGGRFVLKPTPVGFRQVAENEALTMTLARLAGIDVPDHGLVGTADGGQVYWVRRFDRVGRADKLAVEDFAQLGGRTRDTKYDSSMEQVASILDRHTTFPAIDKRRLALRTLFNFVVGNEDMHLKNFSLITVGDIVGLSPAYDLLNTTIVLGGAPEEIALPVRGHKSRLTRRDIVDYFCTERLGLTPGVVADVLSGLRRFVLAAPRWIERSFLDEDLRVAYHDLLSERARRLDLTL